MAGQYTHRTKQRFWSKVKKSNKCWIWTGAKNGTGYGNFLFSKKDGKSVFMAAHRVAFLFEHGHLPKPCGLHKCDNPLCVRPSHIFEGTQKDNIHDMHDKGRNGGGAKSGEKHHLTTLAWSDVCDIRKRLSKGERNADVAKMFNISTGTVSNIKTRKVWKHR